MALPPVEKAESAPALIVEQAKAAAAANHEPAHDATAEHSIPPSSSEAQHQRPHATSEANLSANTDGHERRRSTFSAWAHHENHDAPIENVPPPAYESDHYGKVDFKQDGLDTEAEVRSDGRINININQTNRRLSALLAPALRSQMDLQTVADEHPPPYIPPSIAGEPGQAPPPPMNIVIHVVGSRGDVQPFVALGQVLKQKYGHRVRLATHPTFKQFVEENGLEFFSIGGDPTELMAFMVKNPGLMPGIDSLKNGDVGKRRKGMYEIIVGCWRSCIETGDGTGAEASDDQVDDRQSFESPIPLDPSARPFVADAIIANPPSFAHVHCAERLGIPLHLMFTMPWSPTQAFPHPLANIQSTNAEQTMSNFITYALVETLTWQGLGDVINRFREKSLKLEPVSIMWAPGMITRLRIPYTYCWSPALIPKPKDWGPNIDISGFFFLSLASHYTPAADLQAFLDAGPPPVYIGFGSIVVDDPNAMTKLIFDAVKKTGQRALVSKGWGGFGADEIGIPEGVFMLGNVPHDWLFKHVSCVVHHGGAGTTAAGIALGRPTVVVPFFGDQPFWGSMVARAGAGPQPVPYKILTADKLAASILEALKPSSLERAAELAAKISSEKGAEVGAASFHKQLQMENLRCVLAPSRTAVWRVKRTDIRLSAFAATVLGNEGLLDFNDLKLYRPCEYETDDGPWDPITGGASAIIGTIGSLVAGFSDFPVGIAKGLQKVATDIPDGPSKHKPSGSAATPSTPSHDGGTNSPAPQRTPSTAQSPTVLSPTQSTVSIPGVLSPTESTASLSVVSEPATDPSTPRAEDAPQPDQSGQPPLARDPSRQSLQSLGGHRKSLREHLGGSSSPGQPSSPRSGSPSRNGSHHRHNSLHAMRHFDVAMDTGKGVSKIVGVGLKSPLDFTLSLAKGFHNAPKLYGDDTVREGEKITGLQSGLKAAATEFGYGFYDGISGLMSHPISGAKKEGAAGLIKGFGKGIGGLILKPGAAVWGIPGYTAKGIYKELQKHLGSSVTNYIIASRTAQGYEEWRASSYEERMSVIQLWHSTQIQSRKGRRKFGKEREEEAQKSFHERQKATHERHKASWEDRRKVSDDKRKVRREDHDKREQERRDKEKTAGTAWKPKPRWCPISHFDRPLERSMTFPNRHDMGSKHEIGAEKDEFEAAIQRSISETSKGNPEEDRLIERALRASISELQTAQLEGADHDAIERAVAASAKEAARARAEADAQGGDDAEHEEQLRLALQQSLEEYHLSHDTTHDSHYHEGHDDWEDSDHDEDFVRALEASKLAHAEHTVDPNALDEEMRKVIEESKASHTQPKDDDEEMKNAIEESKSTHEEHEQGLARAKTEEEVVLEYVKKQSLAEEAHKNALTQAKEVPPSVGGGEEANGALHEHEHEDEETTLNKAIEQSLKVDA